MTVTYEVSDRKFKLENPYAIVLKPEYTLVRYGEKDQMEKEYDAIIKRIKNYSDDPKQNIYTQQVIEMLNAYGFEVDYPSISEVHDLVNDYMLIQLPNDQEEFDKITGITGYLKGYFKEVLN